MPEPAVRIKPCHFIFVLIGHQFITVARHRFGQTGHTGRFIRFGLADRFDKCLIARRIGRVLVSGQFSAAVGDDLRQRSRHITFDGCTFRRRANSFHIQYRTPSPSECRFIQVDSNAVQLDRFRDGLRADRNETTLIGIAQHEQIRCD